MILNPITVPTTVPKPTSAQVLINGIAELVPPAVRVLSLLGNCLWKTINPANVPANRDHIMSTFITLSKINNTADGRKAIQMFGRFLSSFSVLPDFAASGSDPS